MTNETKHGRKRSLLKLAGGLVLVLLVGAGFLYGPNLYSLMRAGQEIDKISSDAIRISGPWPRAIDSCFYCHDGPQGNGQNQQYARLVGQPEVYLKKQLKAFASGERYDPTMTPFALSLTDTEFESIVKNFSRMKPQANSSFHGDQARIARGEALAKAANCASCHGQQLQGQGDYPRLAGQSYNYLVDQLSNFKDGKRRDPAGVMPAVAAAFSQQDIEDLAQFLASR